MREEGERADDVMHFIVRERKRRDQASTQTSHIFLRCRDAERQLRRNPPISSRCGKLALFGIARGRKKKGRKEATWAKIPHQVFIKPRLMWSQQQRQQPLNLGSPATKAELQYLGSHFKGLE